MSALVEHALVEHPKHYNDHPSGVECIDIVEHFGFNLGNAVKYIWRAGLKQGASAEEDLKKAAWYVRREPPSVSARCLVAPAGTTLATTAYPTHPRLRAATAGVPVVPSPPRRTGESPSLRSRLRVAEAE